MKKHYRTENDCLNCGAELQGRFCHVCGQENLQIRESFGHMMNHAISDYFHFDYQFFHTLKPLFFKPGKLTNEYMAGKRVQYLHPVKMYIFISLVYFLFLFNSASTADIVKVESKPMTAEQLAKLDQSITTNPGLSPQQKKDVLARIHGYKIVKKGAKTDTIHTYYNKIITDSGDTTYARYLSSQQKLPINNKDGFLKRLYYEKAFAWNKKGIDGKQLLKEDVKHDTPKMMFLLLPLFALLLKITFWKNKKYYVEHLIYSFHLHSFLFLFLTLIMLAQIVIPVNWHTVRDIMYWFATLSIIWYIYTSLRVVYHRTPARTIFKMIGLSFSYLMVFGLCMLFLLLIIVVTAV